MTTNQNNEPVFRLPFWFSESRIFQWLFRNRIKDKNFCLRWNIPWINVFHVDAKGGGIHGFGVDWSPALVEKLIRAGYSGPDADTIVRDWVISQMRDTEAREIAAGRGK